ncbi:hypothetical protein BDL97_18G095700 [Sphagnum fallax]|nr:hypothetical protein BDL97_18G095700 [Sphagnum fallax]
MTQNHHHTTLVETEAEAETLIGADLKISGGPSGEPLPRKYIVSYGMGHMLNDLTSACWFTYLLMFLTDVGLSPREAATVMLMGQLADGFATITVGQLIDRFGHFKIWHAGGSILVGVSFSSVFGGCFACSLLSNSYQVAQTIGYSISASIFNIGWAATQVSHMSLVNCITTNSSSRVALNSCRNAFTMVANLSLYLIAYVVFLILPASQPCDVQRQYSWIAGVAIATGSIFVLFFLLVVKEPRLDHHVQDSKEFANKVGVDMWFSKLLYYQVATVYVLTRLTINVSQALIPFYLIDDLQMGESSKAVIPAIIYGCSFLASILLQELHWTPFHLKFVFSVGAVLWILSSIVFFLLPQSLESLIYVLSLFIGIGNAFMLVTATSMEGVLVSKNLSGCGFVYGSLSFLDKLACGIALYAIEGMNVQTRMCPDETLLTMTFPTNCHCSLIRVALAFVPSGCALLAMILTMTMNLDEPNDMIADLNAPLLLAPNDVADDTLEAGVAGGPLSKTKNPGPLRQSNPIWSSKSPMVVSNKDDADVPSGSYSKLQGDEQLGGEICLLQEELSDS